MAPRPDALDDGPKLADFARAVGANAAAVRAEGERERQFPGSPVGSSRFYQRADAGAFGAARRRRGVQEETRRLPVLHVV